MSKQAPLSLAALERSENPKLVREIVTPEGIPLRFTLARASERAGAFALDLFLQVVVLTILSWIVRAGIGSRVDGSALTGVVVVLAFLLTNFYFAFFEVRWQGATFGKRKVGIRVIDARGGQLETSAVLARNLIRELELWTPMRILVARGTLWPDAPWWAITIAVAWTVVFVFMPLFNRDKLRIGDMIAGTLVVVQPKVVLVPDLVDEAAAARAVPTNFGLTPAPAGRAVKAPRYTFTAQQLSFYGIYELQVLEGLLRTTANALPGDFSHLEALRTVCEKVRKKIGYDDAAAVDDEVFLHEFYVAQRAHLEQDMLFGERREDKHAAR
ncbi:MAG: RDD family protein [Deltaproteobacteria bacterium]|nr:RDD family protein [Deltaproteobacteria bacterium]